MDASNAIRVRARALKWELKSLTVAINLGLPSLARAVEEDTCAPLVGTPHAAGEFLGTGVTRGAGVLHVTHAIGLDVGAWAFVELEEKLGSA